MTYKGQWIREKRAALRASGEREYSTYNPGKKEAGNKQSFTGKESGTKRTFKSTKLQHFTVYFSNGTQKTVSARSADAARSRFSRNKRKTVLKVTKSTE